MYKENCLQYLEKEKALLENAFLKYVDLTEKIFDIFIEYIKTDYEGISENKIYRLFLSTLKEILVLCFENSVSKAFMCSVLSH